MTDEQYYKIMFDRFVCYLALRYNSGEALYIAEWCDETLDRSGRLLGEVRNIARTDPIAAEQKGTQK